MPQNTVTPVASPTETETAPSQVWGSLTSLQREEIIRRLTTLIGHHLSTQRAAPAVSLDGTDHALK